MSSLVYLTWCSTKNRLRARLRRLREPRYAFGSLFGLLYFYSIYFRASGGSEGGAPGLFSNARATGTIELAGAVILFVVAALVWVWPGSRPALQFSRADVQLLFPAPLSRRQLILYRVLRSLVSTLGGVALLTIFALPSGIDGALVFFGGTAVTMTTINLHLIGVSLSRLSLAQRGLRGAVRQWLPLAIISGSVVVLAVTVTRAGPSLATLRDPADIVQSLQQLASTAPAAVVLWPFRTIARLPLSASIHEFLRTVPFGLALLALNLLWVLRSDAAFEEASADRAEHAARARRGIQPVKRRARTTAMPFTLSLSGRAESALLWKNMILLSRYTSLPRLVAFLLPLGVMLGIALYSATGDGVRTSEGLAFACIGGALTAIFLGPHMLRNDLRRDLASLEMLKSWPVPSAAIVRGELLAPVVVLSGAAWLLIVNGAVLASRGPIHIFSTVQSTLAAVAAALIITPGLIAAQILVLNAVAVMFPAWTSIGPGSHGVEVMGQRALLLIVTCVALVVALLPAAVIGALGGFVVYLATGTIPIILPAVIVTAVMLAECMLATEGLGAVLDRTDLTSLDPIE